MCRIGADIVDRCNLSNRRFSQHEKKFYNHILNVIICEPTCEIFNCSTNCHYLRNKQIIAQIVLVIKSITTSLIAKVNCRLHNVKTAYHIRDYILNALNNILPIIGVFNFHLRVLYHGLSLYVIAEFRAHHLSPNFTCVQIFVQKLNKIKSLQKLASIEVAHLTTTILNLDKLLARNLIHHILYNDLLNYIDRKLLCCKTHLPNDYFAECERCHKITFIHRPNKCFTKTVVGNMLRYHKPGSEEYQEYRCHNAPN